ncbi:MAG: uroporphyrinogen-III C-methyltransferase [Sedimentisphaerales bacterium]|nr:uroporphyrinogen-III C-methyltransferase [Sedimentisphaerales bacterium]
MTDTGSVYLVGAGPGNVKLITLRGCELLEQAEVVVYDHLATEGLLRWAPEGAERIYVGKQANVHTMRQEEIIALLIEKARQGKTVVRLKGGDPTIFGRGGEEATALAATGVAFEIVPGVTAASAAGAYAGIPLTHRDCASEVAFITGHEDAQRVGESQVDWELLGRWRGTLVFYMGVKNVTKICEQLQQHGKPRETPAAMVHWAGTARQKTLCATIGTLAQRVAEENMGPPALVIVGEVVKYREKLAWFENRPLFGRTIVVTRARAQASELTERLEQLGAEVIEFPAIRIEPPEDNGPLERAAATIGDYDWVGLTSVNGVETFMEALFAQGGDVRRLAGVKVAAIGSATAGRLMDYGVVADLAPETFTSEALLEAMRQTRLLEGKKVLLARADQADKELPEGLRACGAIVDEVVAYRTVSENAGRMPASRLEAILNADGVDWITFASSGTVRNFFDIIEIERLAEKKVRLASIGPVTSAAIRQLRLSVNVEASEHTLDGLVDAVLQAERKTT